MSINQSDQRIVKAWRMHREGNNAGAISMFQEVVYSDPENIDAFYGLGLAQKASGDLSAAKVAFGAALKNLQDSSAEEAEALAQEHHSETNIRDRYMMLNRMLTQRLDEVGGADSDPIDAQT